MRWKGATQSERDAHGFLRLLRFRWISLAGQALVCSVAWLGLGISLPLLPIACCITIAAATNLLLTFYRSRAERMTGILFPAIIVTDILLLSVILFFCGGAHNPFTIVYLLHSTLAVILLPPWGAWATVALCGACFALLFLSERLLSTTPASACCGDMNAHLQGMLVAMVLTGSGIAYFVSRLNADLDTNQLALERAGKLAERHERFASLATLAAGVAHELATPLGTIALASKDFEHHASNACNNEGCKADARLIRQEVERCRSILEQLGRNTTERESDHTEPIRLGNLPTLLTGYLSPNLRELLSPHVDRPDTERTLPLAPLLQSLAALVKNAAEASPPGVMVILNVAPAERGTVISVIDKGCGIAPDLLGRLGEPFFTTKAPGAGMGLGLFIARTFTERIGGKFDIHSLQGQGTTITLVLPPPNPAKA